jgi:hypothetical protein
MYSTVDIKIVQCEEEFSKLQSYVEIAKFCIPKPIFKVNQMSKLFIPPT